MVTENYSNIIKKIGVKNPNTPSEKELELVFNAYIKDREIYGDIYKAYFNSIQGSISNYINFSIKTIDSNEQMSKKIFDHLHFTKIIISEQLNENNTYEQNLKLLKLIEKADKRVEKEAARNREFQQYVIDRTTQVAIAGISIMGGLYGLSNYLQSDSGKKLTGKVSETVGKNSDKIVNFLKSSFNILSNFKG